MLTFEDEQFRIDDECSIAKHALAEAVWRQAFRGGSASAVAVALRRYDVARDAVCRRAAA